MTTTGPNLWDGCFVLLIGCAKDAKLLEEAERVPEAQRSNCRPSHATRENVLDIVCSIPCIKALESLIRTSTKCLKLFHFVPEVIIVEGEDYCGAPTSAGTKCLH